MRLQPSIPRSVLSRPKSIVFLHPGIVYLLHLYLFWRWDMWFLLNGMKYGWITWLGLCLDDVLIMFHQRLEVMAIGV